MARRPLAEWKASLAGFRLALSLARFRALIASFNERRASLGLLGRRNVVSIVKRRGGGGEPSLKVVNENTRAEAMNVERLCCSPAFVVMPFGEDFQVSSYRAR